LLLKSNDFTGDPDPTPASSTVLQGQLSFPCHPWPLSATKEYMHWSSSEVPNASNNGGWDARGAGNQRTMDAAASAVAPSFHWPWPVSRHCHLCFALLRFTFDRILTIPLQPIRCFCSVLCSQSKTHSSLSPVREASASLRLRVCLVPKNFHPKHHIKFYGTCMKHKCRQNKKTNCTVHCKIARRIF
jgi:hypothetical protein